MLGRSVAIEWMVARWQAVSVEPIAPAPHAGKMSIGRHGVGPQTIPLVVDSQSAVDIRCATAGVDQKIAMRTYRRPFDVEPPPRGLSAETGDAAQQKLRPAGDGTAEEVVIHIRPQPLGVRPLVIFAGRDQQAVFVGRGLGK